MPVYSSTTTELLYDIYLTLNGVLAGKDYQDLNGVLSAKDKTDLGGVLEGYVPIVKYVTYNFVEDEIDNFVVDTTRDKLVNKIIINYGYNWNTNTYAKALIKKEIRSQLIYGEYEKEYSLRMIQSTRLALSIADIVLKTNSYPQYLVSFDHDLRSLKVEVGDYVSITHEAGIGENGYESALGIVVSKKIQSTGVCEYTVAMVEETFVVPTLVSLTDTPDAITENLAITYENGVATLTIVTNDSNPVPIQGVTVNIGSETRVTDVHGQVRFELSPGKYTAALSGQGYQDINYSFYV